LLLVVVVAAVAAGLAAGWVTTASVPAGQVPSAFGLTGPVGAVAGFVLAAEVDVLELLALAVVVAGLAAGFLAVVFDLLVLFLLLLAVEAGSSLAGAFTSVSTLVDLTGTHVTTGLAVVVVCDVLLVPETGCASLGLVLLFELQALTSTAAITLNPSRDFFMTSHPACFGFD